ncbi:MAG: macro domain-containing protein [Candidatus Altiarchaeota archaeon]|nr:macro domain-containing protein [Candidatus Altiarchaeota archaeon]
MALVSALKGDITSFRCDAIVNPANSYGVMGGGVAFALKRVGGQVIEDEAVALAPIPVGVAVSTSAGNLQCKYVIHAPTMHEPAELVGVENVLKATDAALKCASSLGISSLAFPGMGTGVGGVHASAAAEAMVSSICDFNPSFDVYLIGFTDVLTFEFRRWIQNLMSGTR